MKPLNLLKDLVRFQTITPKDCGILSFMARLLGEHGFVCDIQEFTDPSEGSQPTSNLYAKTKNNSDTNLCFAGHVDVVHPGKESLWTYPPFEPTVENDMLYGRGACDMKGAISCFIVAATEFLSENPGLKGDISLLITGDEEGSAVNGTKKMLKYITQKGEKITDCLVGEPTSNKTLGDTVKIGRRGSVNFALEVKGKQGHVAYPLLATNPIPVMARIITDLTNYEFDQGSEFFQKTNLEVVNIDTGNVSSNVIPHSTSCNFNVRFGNEHTSQDVVKIVDGVIRKNTENTSGASFSLSYRVSGESFLSQNSRISQSLCSAIQEVLSIRAEVNTQGGTSDARFIKDYSSVAEFGMLNATAHQVDESVPLKDIENLYKVYRATIRSYFL